MAFSNGEGGELACGFKDSGEGSRLNGCVNDGNGRETVEGAAGDQVEGGVDVEDANIALDYKMLGELEASGMDAVGVVGPPPRGDADGVGPLGEVLRDVVETNVAPLFFRPVGEDAAKRTPRPRVWRTVEEIAKRRESSIDAFGKGRAKGILYE